MVKPKSKPHACKYRHRNNHAILFVQLGIDGTRDVYNIARYELALAACLILVKLQVSLIALIPNSICHRMITYICSNNVYLLNSVTEK